MSPTKHTKKPWEETWEAGNWTIGVPGADDRFILEADGDDEEAIEARLRLASQAPAMARALLALISGDTLAVGLASAALRNAGVITEEDMAAIRARGK
jgi:hypothetical protein